MEMVLGVMEDQIRGGYFLDSILDPSVVDRIVQPLIPHLPVGVAEAEESLRPLRAPAPLLPPGPQGVTVHNHLRPSLPCKKK